MKAKGVYALSISKQTASIAITNITQKLLILTLERISVAAEEKPHIFEKQHQIHMHEKNVIEWMVVHEIILSSPCRDS